MSDLEKKRIDEGLQGNEKIESAIKALQQNPSECLHMCSPLCEEECAIKVS